MRPTLVLGFLAAVAAAVTLDVPASADGSPPAPTFAVSAGKIVVSTQGGSHVNNQFPWSFKDASGTKVAAASFSLGTGTATSATVTNIPTGPNTTLRGAYCSTDASGSGSCYTFTAACTASSCAVTGI
jgi:hypothetical protein